LSNIFIEFKTFQKYNKNIISLRAIKVKKYLAFLFSLVYNDEKGRAI